MFRVLVGEPGRRPWPCLRQQQCAKPAHMLPLASSYHAARPGRKIVTCTSVYCRSALQALECRTESGEASPAEVTQPKTVALSGDQATSITPAVPLRKVISGLLCTHTTCSQRLSRGAGWRLEPAPPTPRLMLGPQCSASFRHGHRTCLLLHSLTVQSAEQVTKCSCANGDQATRYTGPRWPR